MSDTIPETPVASTPKLPPAGGGPRHKVSLILLAAFLLLAAGGVAFYWMKTRPQATRRAPKGRAVLVDVQTVRASKETLLVDAMGTVVPARATELASRVRGEIIAVDPRFIPGGRFTTKEQLVKVDPKDFELAILQRQAQRKKSKADVAQAASAILQRKADLAKAEAELVLEQGRRSAALGEYELLGEAIKPEDKSLVLREPQLKQAQATCASAEAACQAAAASLDAAKAVHETNGVLLEQARLDLKRTAICTRFNAIIVSRNVNLGSNVSVNSPLASLVGTDQYWVEISIPADELKWIKIPGFNSTTGSAVTVHCGETSPVDASRQGVVTRLMGEIEPQGRMARLLITVDDPLDLKVPVASRRPLILGSYVRVEITAATLDSVVRINRTALRDGKKVWVMTPKKTLEIRDVEILWASDDHVCLSSGLRPGEQLIVSDLGTPVVGLELRVQDGPAEKEVGP